MTSVTHLLAESTPWLQRYGYFAVALSVMLEGTGIPLPGLTLMGGAAVLAAQGALNVTWVWLIAWLAATAGDNLGYWVGHAGGSRLLLRTGIGRTRLGRLRGFFRHYGVWLILFGRFVDGTRQLNGLVAGSARMPYRRFLAADAIGTLGWVSLWVAGLYTLDRHALALHGLLVQIRPHIIATVATLLFLGAAVSWWIHAAARRPQRRKTHKPVRTASHARATHGCRCGKPKGEPR
ncbi:MAG: DedA family protein [Gammaproteobacteria bacterium]|nr:DedA family protein [Gammaproteobacteria bacterium]